MPSSIGINSLLGELPKNFTFNSKLPDCWLPNSMVQAVCPKVQGCYGEGPNSAYGVHGAGRKLGEPLQSLRVQALLAWCWNMGAEGKWEAPEYLFNIPMYHFPELFGPLSCEYLLSKPNCSCGLWRACGRSAGHSANKAHGLREHVKENWSSEGHWVLEV